MMEIKKRGRKLGTKFINGYKKKTTPEVQKTEITEVPTETPITQ
jgi:hypothetical protein